MLKFEKENGRYYYLYVQKDMFDDTVLILFRGGRNQHVKRIMVCDKLKIDKEIERLSKRRLKRGYTLIT